MPKYIASEAPFAAANARFLKNRSGSIGAFARASQATNAASRTTPRGERADDLRAAPAVGVAVHEPPDEAEQAAARERRDRAGRAPCRAVGLVEHPREREHREPDRDVEPEDPLPGDPVDDGAADERARRDGKTGDPGPGAERDAALLGRECGREERQRQRSHDGAADPLDGARCDQRLHRGRERRCGGRSGEQAEAEDEHPAAAEAVAQRGAGQQEDGERERVRVHRPLELLDRRAEVGADHRQRRRDDEVVEHDHEQRDRGDRERPGGLRLGLHQIQLLPNVK